MRLQILIACAALCGAAAGSLADPATPPTATPPAQAAPFRLDPILLGTWRDPQGHLLPPGVSLFETIHSTLTLAADGTFTLTVDKATGLLRQRGKYTVEGDRLTLSFPFGPVAYGFSRRGERLVLKALGAGTEIDLVSVGPATASGGPVSPAVAVAGPGPHGQQPNTALHRTDTAIISGSLASV